MRRIFLLLISISILASCFKQDPPKLESSAPEFSNHRLEACTGLNINLNLLSHNNVLSLFECTAWDEKFPILFARIKKISPQSWNHLLSPFDTLILNDREKRERIFKNVRELDSQGSLDGLSHAISTLSETNANDTIRLLLLCAKDSQNKECEGRSKISSADIRDLIRGVSVLPKIIKSMAYLAGDLSTSIAPIEEEWSDQYTKFSKDNIFITKRINFLNAVGEKLEIGQEESDRHFIKSIFHRKFSGTKKPWLYEWLHSENLNMDSFVSLFTYSFRENRRMVKEISTVKKYFSEDLQCHSPFNEAPLRINLEKKYEDFVITLLNKEHDQFLSYLLNDEFMGQATLSFCPEISQLETVDNEKVNLLEVLLKLSNYFTPRLNFDFIKYLYSFNPKSDIADSGKYLLDLFSGTAFKTLSDTGLRIDELAPTYWNNIFALFSAASPNTFLALGDILRVVSDESYDQAFRGLSRVWLFQKEKEKNFFLRFFDGHFDEGVGTSNILKFYSRMLEEISAESKELVSHWAGDEERITKTYKAFEEFAMALHGDPILVELREFFSRDHIILVLETITRTLQLDPTLTKLPDYVAIYRDTITTTQIPYRLPYQSVIDQTISKINACLNDLSEQGFYTYITKMPESCSHANLSEFSLRLSYWLNDSNDSYRDFFGYTNDFNLWDSQGLAHPRMLKLGLSVYLLAQERYFEIENAKIWDALARHFYEIDYESRGKKRVGLFEDIDNLFAIASRFLKTQKFKNQVYRDGLTAKLLEGSFSGKTNAFFREFSSILNSYADWVDDGFADDNLRKTTFVRNDKYSCKTFLNQGFDIGPCPTSEEIKINLNKVLKGLIAKQPEAEKVPLDSFVEMSLPGNGLRIPLDAINQRNFRLSPKMLINFLFETTSDEYSINKTVVSYQHKDGEERSLKVRTVERLDEVIRSVRFRNNYLGVQFHNAAAFTTEYSKTARSKWNQLKLCTSWPLSCGRPMPKDERRMAKNSVSVFPALFEIAENGYEHGDIIQALMTMIVGTSSPSARDVRLFPLKDEDLLKHNGKILTDLSLISASSNAGRFIIDRIAENKSQLNDFFNTQSFKIFERSFLRGFVLEETKETSKSLIIKLIEKDQAGVSTLDQTVEWLSGLSYSELRLVEDTMAKLFVTFSYLGPPSQVFENYRPSDPLSPVWEIRYRDNNLFSSFKALSILLNYWPSIKNFVPSDFKLISVFRPLNNFFAFYKEGLMREEGPSGNIYYHFLNRVFKIVEDVFFNRYAYDTNSVAGIELFLESFKNEKQVIDTFNVGGGLYNYLSRIHYKDISQTELDMSVFRVNSKILEGLSDGLVDYGALENYLRLISPSEICSNNECAANPHYNEIANIIHYLSSQESNVSRLNTMLDRMFFSHKDDFKKLLDDVFHFLNFSSQ